MVRILFLLFISSFLFLTPFHASAQEERAAPRSGEGISAFLQRNKRPGKAYYLEFLELNKNSSTSRGLGDVYKRQVPASMWSADMEDPTPVLSVR